MRAELEWNQTSEILAMIANLFRKRPISADAFHPMKNTRRRVSSGVPITAANIDLLKVFVPGESP